MVARPTSTNNKNYHRPQLTESRRAFLRAIEAAGKLPMRVTTLDCATGVGGGEEPHLLNLFEISEGSGMCEGAVVADVGQRKKAPRLLLLPLINYGCEHCLQLCLPAGKARAVWWSSYGSGTWEI